MGATPDDKFASLLERPRHRVTIRGLAAGRFPVTVGQWEAYVADDSAASRPRGSPIANPDCPVAGLSRLDVQDYLRWLRAKTGRAYRLPSEAEWEYCCRAGTRSVFSTGHMLTTDDANYLYDEFGVPVGPGRRTPYGTYPPNAFGLSDCHGNVCELVEDAWFDTYEHAPSDGRPRSGTTPPSEIDLAGQLFVMRGGSWDQLPRLLRCAFRDWAPAGRRLDHVGFRVVLDVSGIPAQDGSTLPKAT